MGALDGNQIFWLIFWALLLGAVTVRAILIWATMRKLGYDPRNVFQFDEDGKPIPPKDRQPEGSYYFGGQQE